MIDYKLSEVAKICSTHFYNDCKDCPFYLRNFDNCVFDYCWPYDFFKEQEVDDI